MGLLRAGGAIRAQGGLVRGAGNEWLGWRWVRLASSVEQWA